MLRASWCLMERPMALLHSVVLQEIERLGMVPNASSLTLTWTMTWNPDYSTSPGHSAGNCSDGGHTAGWDSWKVSAG